MHPTFRVFICRYHDKNLSMLGCPVSLGTNGTRDFFEGKFVSIRFVYDAIFIYRTIVFLFSFKIFQKFFSLDLDKFLVQNYSVKLVGNCNFSMINELTRGFSAGEAIQSIKHAYEENTL